MAKMLLKGVMSLDRPEHDSKQNPSITHSRNSTTIPMYSNNVLQEESKEEQKQNNEEQTILHSKEEESKGRGFMTTEKHKAYNSLIWPKNKVKIHQK